MKKLMIKALKKTKKDADALEGQNNPQVIKMKELLRERQETLQACLDAAYGNEAMLKILGEEANYDV